MPTERLKPLGGGLHKQLIEGSSSGFLKTKVKNTIMMAVYWSYKSLEAIMTFDLKLSDCDLQGAELVKSLCMLPTLNPKP